MTCGKAWGHKDDRPRGRDNAFVQATSSLWATVSSSVMVIVIIIWNNNPQLFPTTQDMLGQINDSHERAPRPWEVREEIQGHMNYTPFFITFMLSTKVSFLGAFLT